MPIYILVCERCQNKVEEFLGMDEANPRCSCGGEMYKAITSPATITVKNGRYPVRSKGYKEGYSKEYLRDVSPETHA